MCYKVILLFLYCLISVSCTTFHYYYPHHKIKNQSFYPVKKGLIELRIRHESTHSQRVGHINNKNSAYKKGLENVKGTIYKFCHGKYKITDILGKKQKIGTTSGTNYSRNSHYNHHPYNKHVRSNNLFNFVLNNFVGAQGSAVTTTIPIFKQYTEIKFRCGK